MLNQLFELTVYQLKNTCTYIYRKSQPYKLMLIYYVEIEKNLKKVNGMQNALNVTEIAYLRFKNNKYFQTHIYK